MTFIFTHTYELLNSENLGLECLKVREALHVLMRPRLCSFDLRGDYITHSALYGYSYMLAHRLRVLNSSLVSRSKHQRY